ncbi:MAG: hypothetical protein JOZ96_17935 [Acidobacteria bacterium]|nr:hypothetical protein [Acidobacteriota bacterium]
MSENIASAPNLDEARVQKHLDFKLYLDAATQAVTRTRNSLYLLLTVAVVFLTVYVNTTVLDWAGARFEKMQVAYDCLQEPEKANTRECISAKEYVEELHLRGETDKPSTQEKYKEQLGALLRLRGELRRIQLPIFGSVLDVNDLGLASAILFFIFLIVLRSNFYRELDSLTSAKKRAEVFKVEEKNPQLYEESYEMLRRIPVLSSPKRDNRGFRWSAMVIITLAVIVHALIIWNDWKTSKIAFLLIGDTKSYVFYGIEWSGFVFLCLLWYVNIKVWLKLAYLFHEKTPPRWAKFFIGKGSYLNQPVVDEEPRGETPPVPLKDDGN